MAIPNETHSSEHLLASTLYHVAALTADPASAELVVDVEVLVDGLQSALDARKAVERAELETLAGYNRADLEQRRHAPGDAVLPDAGRRAAVTLKHRALRGAWHGRRRATEAACR
jgi:hypothetical protein